LAAPPDRLRYVLAAFIAVLLHLTSEITFYVAVVTMIARSLFTLAYGTKINLVRSLSRSTGMPCIAPAA
jgi:hypothetical protein